MHLALEIAQFARGQTSPNPMVGAIVVQTQQIVGIGVHLRAGEAHAEVHALEMAQEKAKGATLYVTLEPCTHFGRTPPCADRVIQSGIKRVVIAALDPNPLVSGRGVQKLKEAGLIVEVGLMGKESEEMNEIFNYFIVHNLPFVTLKMATTLDGKIATITGESKWITSEEARADVHQLRHQVDAILVGINTVIKDNPKLTTRLNGEEGKHPIRIILDSTLRTPLHSEILDTCVAATWIFTSKNVTEEQIQPYREKGIRVLQTDSPSKVSLQHMLQILGENHISSLLIEGGGETNATFLQGNHVNKIITYIAPKLIGGNMAPSAFRGEGFAHLAQAATLKNVSYIPIGNDLKVIGYLK